MLQLPVPYVLTQLRLTVPVNPSCDEIVIGPVVPVLPAFTLGKGAASVMTKVGLGTTSTANVVVRAWVLLLY